MCLSVLNLSCIKMHEASLKAHNKEEYELPLVWCHHVAMHACLAWLLF